MTEADTTEAGTGFYVYGLLDHAATPVDPNLADPSRADLSWADLGAGIAAAPVRLLQPKAMSASGLTALVSDIALGPVAQTRRNMIAHTAVLERAMATATVLPMRFGTVAPDAATLAGCIDGHAAEFRTALATIAGCVELGVKAHWREGVVFAEIVAGDTELARLRDRLRSRPASETYYERFELGRRVEAALVERRAAETAAILAELVPLVEREVELRTLEEDMILNRAFLVSRSREADFDAAIGALAERSAARVAFRYVGPVPPYNFVQLQAGWLRGAA